jgi:hypothetical protein
MPQGASTGEVRRLPQFSCAGGKRRKSRKPAPPPALIVPHSAERRVFPQGPDFNRLLLKGCAPPASGGLRYVNAKSGFARKSRKRMRQPPGFAIFLEM